MEEEILFRLKEGVTLTEEAEGALLVDPKTEQTAVLNVVGSVLLKICDGELKREKMVEVLREKYPEKTMHAIEADVASFLVQLSNVIEPDNIPDGASKNILAYVCPPPSAMSFALTSACNLQCKHCSATAGKPLPDELSTSEWLKLVSEIAEIGVSLIALTGGEPFLRNDVFEIIEKIMEFPMGLRINTNATLLTEDLVRQLSAMPRLPFIGVSVSVDGAQSESHDWLRGDGTFEKTIRGLELLANYGIIFKLFTVVTKHNRHELEDILQLAKQLGAREIEIGLVIMSGRAPCYVEELHLSDEETKATLADVEKLAKKYPRFVVGSCLQMAERLRAFRRNVDIYYPRSGKMMSCGAGVALCTIRPDGTVVPCDMSLDFKAGNIREDDFWQIWQSSETLRWIRSFRGMDINELEGCQTCNYRELCIGNCPAAAYAETGIWSCRSSLCVTPEIQEV